MESGEKTTRKIIEEEVAAVHPGRPAATALPKGHPTPFRLFMITVLLILGVGTLVQFLWPALSPFSFRGEALLEALLLEVLIFPILYLFLFRPMLLHLTGRLKAEERLQLVGEVFESTREGILITDAEARILEVNKAFTDITGYTAEEAIGQKPSLLKSNWHDEQFYQEMWRSLNETGTWEGEIRNRRKNKELFVEHLTIFSIKNRKGEVTHYVGIFVDVTEEKSREERIHHLAHYDPLTDLPNRSLFEDRLRHSLERAHRHQKQVALLFIDVDNFKNINDSFGHQVGDQFLQSVAERLTGCLRREDTVARLGGDEFAVILEDTRNAQDAVIVAQKIFKALSEPFGLQGQEVFATASMGIALYPQDADNPVDLAKSADTAMYRAKEQGKNIYQFYTAEMITQALKRLAMEASLRRALEREEFLLHYQPQVDLKTGQIIGTEALIRWQHPELGMISPAEFIPLAEETGLIVPLGQWVLRTACAQNQKWQAAGFPPLRMAVNISGRQLKEETFPEMVMQVLQETGLHPSYLELEITESILMESVDSAVERLSQLKSLGVNISIDDFGTGYSSMSYLKRFPIDKLKIDSSFVRDVPHDPDDVAINAAIIAMAHHLRLAVIAEGTATAEQLTFLREKNCDQIQGFFFSRPIPAEEFTQLLQEGKRLELA